MTPFSAQRIQRKPRVCGQTKIVGWDAAKSETLSGQARSLQRLKAGGSKRLLDFRLEQVRDHPKIDCPDAGFAEHQEDPEVQQATEKSEYREQKTQADQDDGNQARPIAQIQQANSGDYIESCQAKKENGSHGHTDADQGRGHRHAQGGNDRTSEQKAATNDCQEKRSEKT
jgi:hypothetical protein